MLTLVCPPRISPNQKTRVLELYLKPETRVFFGGKPGFHYVLIINKEIQWFEATKQRPENSEKLHRSPLTIRLMSVEAERTVSALGLLATKIRSRLNDDTLNAMIVMRQFFKK